MRLAASSSPSSSFLATILALAVAASLSILSVGIAEASVVQPCPFSAGSDGFGAISNLKPTFAQHFAMTFGTNHVVLTTTSSGPSYVLYLCNSERPTVTAPSNALYLQVPINSVAVASDGIATFIERLNQRSSITSISPNLITSPCLEALAPASVAYNATEAPTGADVLFSSSITNLIASESTPLARAEWILFFDAFFGLQNAPFIFQNKIVAEYNCIRNKLAAYTGDKPTVAVAAVSDAGQFSTPDYEYWAKIISDLNTSPALVPSGSSVGFDDWSKLVAKADMLIDMSVISATDKPYSMSQWSKRYGLTKVTPGYNFIDGDLSGVFRPDGRTIGNGYDDFPQANYAQPELFLADLAYRLDVTFDKKFFPYWLRDLALDLVDPTEEKCTDRSKFAQFLSGDYCPANATYAPSIGRFNTGASGATPTPGNSSDGSDSGMSKGAVAGVVVAVILLATAVGAGAFIYVVRMRRSKVAAERKFFKMEDEFGPDNTSDDVRLTDASRWATVRQ
ncbi:hypothetical protein DFJ73DRAFT_781842 [Zopfochytrium polystomum]|nr:hypothetical protein DFJ73DRAFT_781842 [Zopfochytrium polystomum]